METEVDDNCSPENIVAKMLSSVRIWDAISLYIYSRRVDDKEKRRIIQAGN